MLKMSKNIAFKITPRNSIYVLVLLVIALLLFSFDFFVSLIVDDNNENGEYYTVTRVIDGDTIEVERNGEVFKIRYIGVDTPETVKPDSPVECFGKEASDFNKSLVLNKKVKLESDVQDTDKFNRKLRYVNLEDGRMVNKILIEEGYAKTLTIPPNVKYAELFRELEQNARRKNIGLWEKCQ